MISISPGSSIAEGRRVSGLTQQLDSLPEAGHLAASSSCFEESRFCKDGSFWYHHHAGELVSRSSRAQAVAGKAEGGFGFEGQH